MTARAAPSRKTKATAQNETPLASPWSKLTGTDANLTSGIITFSAAAFYKHTTAYPGGSGEARHAKVQFRLSTDGGIELPIGLTDASNYFAASLVYDSDGCSVLSATMVSAGVGEFGGGCVPQVSVTPCVDVPGLTAGQWLTLEVCLLPNIGGYGYTTNDLVIAVVTLPSGKKYTARLEAAGPAVGAYSGLRSTMAVEFRRWSYTYYRNSPEGEHRACPNCGTGCFIGGDDMAAANLCGWQVLNGSYTSGGGTFDITADNTQVAFGQFHPGLKTTQIVTVQVRDNGLGRVFIGNGLAALDSQPSGHTLALFDNTPTELDSDDDEIPNDADKWLNLTICYSLGRLSVKVVGNGMDLCASALCSTKRKELIGYPLAAIRGHNSATSNSIKATTSQPATPLAGRVPIVLLHRVPLAIPTRRPHWWRTSRNSPSLRGTAVPPLTSGRMLTQIIVRTWWGSMFS